jgi:hypothetical protein
LNSKITFQFGYPTSDIVPPRIESLFVTSGVVVGENDAEGAIVGASVTTGFGNFVLVLSIIVCPSGILRRKG